MVTPRGIAELSFALTSSSGLDLWPGANADAGYRNLNEQGRVRARELVEYMRANQAPMALGHVVGALVNKGNYGALEIGFAAEIADRLIGAGESVYRMPIREDYPVGAIEHALPRTN